MEILRIREIAERTWKLPITGWILFITFSILWLRWKWHTPSPGKAVAALAVAAAFMSLRELSGIAKFVWVLLLFGLLFVEMRAVDRDKREMAQELGGSFKSVFDQANKNLQQITDVEHENLARILDTQRRHFAATINRLLQSESEQRREFTAMLNKQQELYAHEEKLMESFGGSFFPGSEPTPDNPCGKDIPKGSVVLLFANDNAAVVSQFPQIVVIKRDFGPVIDIDRRKDGAITLLLDIRGRDDKIIVRSNADGFVLNRNGYLLVKRDKSTLTVIDEYGEEILDARYLNPNAFRLRGVLQRRGQNPIPIALPKNFSGSCFRGSPRYFVSY